MCTEEKWYGVFAKHIQPHHQLSKLTINLDGWNTINLHHQHDWYAPKYEMTFVEDRYRLQAWRRRLLDFLDDYVRGISYARISCINVAGRGLTRRQLDGLEMTMSKPRETALRREPKQKVSFLALVKRVRLDRERRESLQLASDYGFDWSDT